jgi:peroxiredoxin Q/BCP
VSFDTVADNRAFAEKFDFNFPLLCDESRAIGLAYGACDSANARNAKRISYLIGEDGVIRTAYPKVDAARHPEEVLRSL